MDYTIRSGLAAMNFPQITALLAKTFWCPGITLAEAEYGAQHSAVVIGAFAADGRQIGYARAISDQTRFAYIVDVIVDEPARGLGVGRALVQGLLDHPDLAAVYQWLLITRDAHGLYEKLGFQVAGRADDWLEIRRPRPTTFVPPVQHKTE